MEIYIFGKSNFKDYLCRPKAYLRCYCFVTLNVLMCILLLGATMESTPEWSSLRMSPLRRVCVRYFCSSSRRRRRWWCRRWPRLSGGRRNVTIRLSSSKRPSKRIVIDSCALRDYSYRPATRHVTTWRSFRQLYECGKDIRAGAVVERASDACVVL